MSIYRIYSENRNSAGFWVQHRTWQNMCAQVQSIGGQQRGALPGASPEHGHAPVIVEFFDVRSGRSLKVNPLLDHPEDRGFVMIAEPPWHTPTLVQETKTL